MEEVRESGDERDAIIEDVGDGMLEGCRGVIDVIWLMKWLRNVMLRT